VARAVYSHRFLYGTINEISTEGAGPVPAGYVWVIRDLTAYAYGFGDGAYPGFLWTLAPAGGGSIMVWGTPLALIGRQYTWNGRVVLYEGDQLLVAGAGETYWDVTASGYTLTLP
jgi:hypothetical protein